MQWASLKEQVLNTFGSRLHSSVFATTNTFFSLSLDVTMTTPLPQPQEEEVEGEGEGSVTLKNLWKRGPQTWMLLMRMARRRSM